MDFNILFVLLIICEMCKSWFIIFLLLYIYIYMEVFSNVFQPYCTVWTIDTANLVLFFPVCFSMANKDSFTHWNTTHIKYSYMWHKKDHANDLSPCSKVKHTILTNNNTISWNAMVVPLLCNQTFKVVTHLVDADDVLSRMWRNLRSIEPHSHWDAIHRCVSSTFSYKIWRSLTDKR